MRLERMISQDGALILKFWFHLTKDKQRKRLKELEKDPATRWRVTADDKANMERYDTIRKYGEHMIRLTNTAYAPWIVVDGEDANFRSLTVGQTILKAIRNRMSQNGHVVDASEAPPLLARSTTR
jgi:polyphosphate kinase 2 (PPK2 family)